MQWSLVGPDTQGVRFNSQADPILDSIGDARVSHPDEFKQIMSDLEANNVRVNIDTRSSTIAYDPDGNTIHLPERFSISALRHEVGHFVDHKNLGSPRFIEYFRYPELRVATERRQYLNEIRFAREIGDDNARRTLIQNYLNERKDIVDNYYQRPYGGRYNSNPFGGNQ